MLAHVAGVGRRIPIGGNRASNYQGIIIMSDPNATPPVGNQHRNDMYGNIESRSESDEGVSKPIPAATVVLLRDGDDGVEVLMLRKNSKITFGGMWVFPGGKIDADDFEDPDNASGSHDQLRAAAYAAAVRETSEEAGIDVSADKFVWFSHWTPPPGPQKRFATWFFAAHVTDEHRVVIDDGEIKAHAWINPAVALARHAAGELDLVPPTWLTLHHIAQYSPSVSVIEHFQSRDPKVYTTRVVMNADSNRVALWHGDAGYEHWEAGIEGERHRLVMDNNSFVFENTVEKY
jgi:8-oxo-dGTP pyrophosphatase MutT (NUDIX family)